MIEERTGVITFQGNPLTLLGKGVSVGETAPEFCVLANDLTPRTLADYKGKVLVISVVPSLDTPVCDMQTRPFQHRSRQAFRQCPHPDHQLRPPLRPDPLVRSRRSGRRRNPLRPPRPFLWYGYGVAIKELRLLSRAVFVICANGVIAYEQIVKEVTHDVDFEAALGAVKAALKNSSAKA